MTENVPEVIEEFDPDKAIARIEKSIDFINKLRGILKEGEDFNKHPGYERPALEKPGAEKIAAALNCGPEIIRGEEGKIIDEQYGLKEFNLVIALINRATGLCYGQGVGYGRASVKDLYAYDKEEKKRLLKPERAEWANNTALKMAFKSGLICASLSVGALSGYFTQDLNGVVAQKVEEKSQKSPTKNKVFTGIPVPKKYWTFRKTDRKAAQELLGGDEYGYAKNPDTGQWEITKAEKEKKNRKLL